MQDNAEPDVGQGSLRETNAIKRPPPERPETIQAKSLVVFSFWAVVVFLGLPVWWWTTSIHRASLPVQEMLDWADGKVCILVHGLTIGG
jgi:GPI-anchor transamidase subunit S